MTLSQFKPEPISKQIRRVWRENRGNWLLAVGLLVSLLAWLVGYFNLIPEIEAVDHPNLGTTLIGGSTLTVDIVGCESDKGKVIAMLYDGRGFNDSSIPLRMQSLTIEDQRAHWDVHNLSYGSYAVYAFQDLDNNEVVDPKSERQGISFADTEQGKPVNYAAAAFDFSPQQKSIKFELH